MIRKLLVANRGEIARRVFATCRTLGVATVAVHSDADAGAPFVAEADQAVRLPGNTPAETYLRVGKILDAARRAGADAVHPGYGFLAENAEFAAAVTDAGLTWVGPPAKAIAAMGDKMAAKALLADAGVPMLPTWTGDDQVTDFPVLVKASAGGGGRGMRVVRDRAGLAEAVASARREAAAAFGDGTVFIERYVERGRHVEVQIFGDTHGTVMALGERDCSIQRRHQKIVEEAPAVLPPGLRERLHAAAVAAGRAVDYVGAGTVEFLLAPDGDFFFLEMNTRLQVEHPVTEAVTGLDLVRLQLLVAEGEPLPLAATPPADGHAIEVRLCAEDPAQGFRPATGTLHRFALPGVAGEFTPLRGLRLDSGVADGSAVSVHYDSMLAKVVAWAPTRAEAARALAGALARAELHGVATNRDLLVRVLRSPAFGAVELDTGFLERHEEVFAPLLPADQLPVAALAAALAGAARRREAAPVLAGLPSGWRNVPAFPQVTRFTGPDGGELTVRYRLSRTGELAEWSLSPAAASTGPDGTAPGGDAAAGDPTPVVTLVEATPDRVILDVDGVRRVFRVHRVGSAVFVDGPDGAASLTELPRFPLPTAELAAGSLLAPLPGAVTRVHVEVGQRVTAGDLLLTLEAMKLEHPVLAPTDGVVAELPVPAGGQVETGAVLAVVDPEEDPR
ncbi:MULTISPECIES: biotin carboxylase N-terminal domain-containing protein [Micromonospora]|uniref:Biotin/lipoyl-binding protein n=1 Tax=Micromonospora solifontis TaxID=2487138 RepID=A0ABX9WGT6_9ACTN|nr:MULTISPECIES: biotin carboxylase N-terminal domain-containing protein [Micromonospora]NES14745.1 biotin/lipoyl-binding protein [Micromonospora sp. PPF5-17B]NES36726.1 biotin/lipoyl-binding protein [Micromonospora solifontis]NES55753.1 biotin/lipoyl-binding protein [Micromonospora sp. PPF5-6]RNL99187.1 biotin/lipoyl-binding protein [Micromonospora solifontis]